jgi:uncharacterized protein (TIGR02118 family)
MYRVLFASYRRKGLTRQQFLDHYLSVHVAIARRFPGLRDYQIFPMPADAPDVGGPDSFATMAFENEDAFKALIQSAVFAEAVKDNETQLDHYDTYVVGHVRVI